MSKILGIGLSKTGTSSLVEALTLLGFTATHRNELARLETCDAAAEVVFAARFKELDLRYPGSKFILTTRDKAAWLRSCARWFEVARELQWRMDVFGAYRYDEQKWSAAWDRHHAEVERYFRRRPQHLLTLRICEGEGWEPLCRFLGVPIPALPFPHLRPVREERPGGAPAP